MLGEQREVGRQNCPARLSVCWFVGPKFPSVDDACSSPSRGEARACGECDGDEFILLLCGGASGPLIRWSWPYQKYSNNIAQCEALILPVVMALVAPLKHHAHS